MSNRKTNFLEGILVFAVMTGLLLPVRLVFVTYVSDNWFGSFGIISAISIVMIVLVKKGKLGKFGEIFERQLSKIQHGKKGMIVYGQAILFLMILGGTIFAIEMGNSVYAELKEEILVEHEELSQPDSLIAQSEEFEAQDWAFGIIGLIIAVFFAFPQVAAVFAVLNQTFDGWILHFYTVAFVEYLEFFGILIFYRFFGTNLKKPVTNG